MSGIRLKLKTEGVPRTQRALKGVKAGVQNRVLKAAIAKVARKAGKSAKGLLSVRRTGALKRSIGVVYRAYRRGLSFAYVVGPRKGFRSAGKSGEKIDPSKYSHLVERGRAEVRPLKAKLMGNRATGVVYGLRARAVGARPFMGPAADEVRGAGQAAIQKDVRAGVRRESWKYWWKGKSIYTPKGS